MGTASSSEDVEKDKFELERLLDLLDFPSSAHVASILFAKKRVVCYGAGSGYTTFSTFVLQPEGIKVDTILDRKYLKKEFVAGVLHCPPAEFRPTVSELNECIVVITVGKSDLMLEIVEFLQSVGVKEYLFAWDIYEYHRHFFSAEFKEYGFDFFRRAQKQIFDCFDCLADNESKTVFCKVLF